MTQDLTQGSIMKNLARFSVPYLIASFLQTFYGLADLFITGQFRGAGTITAVSVGSQVMHMLTVMIVGLALGVTVLIGRAVGEKDRRKIGRFAGSAGVLFLALSLILTVVLLLCVDGIVALLRTPPEAEAGAKAYLQVCFMGLPAILFFNLLSGIFRGLGDTRSPMIFVACAGVVNIGLDYLLIGPFDMGAWGAAFATVLAQVLSVALAALVLWRRRADLGMERRDLRVDLPIIGQLLKVGLPIMVQEGIIQVSFLIITMIANGRGVEIAAAVGIVEKIIGFLFLVPSAMMSSVSAITAQNAGAGRHDRGLATLKTAMLVCQMAALFFILVSEFWAPGILGLFTRDAAVIRLGSQYLRTYVLDCAAASIHFCFSGYFTAYGRSLYSFAHNVISALTVRIPGAWLAAVYWPATLYAMGIAAPLGSVLSDLICLGLYMHGRPVWRGEKK